LPIVLFLAIAFGQDKTAPCSHCAEWNTPQKPFRIFGNTYYVGPHGLSSILITSNAGHVLIDGALPESSEHIVSNIRSLGFRIEDVKLILNSHVHFDHAGGIAELQKLSGARVMASEWSAAVLKSGRVGKGDPQYGELRPVTAVKNVRVLRDGESFTVGPIEMTAHLTPGHTPGGTSWTWKSCEHDVCRNVVYADSLSPISAKGFRFSASQNYPRALDDFEKSFRFLEAAPCHILITTHPGASSLWIRLTQRENGVVPDPMVNANACRDLAREAREQLKQRLAEEEATKPAK
jgi:metallo-beta-lactamase class B